MDPDDKSNLGGSDRLDPGAMYSPSAEPDSAPTNIPADPSQQAVDDGDGYVRWSYIEDVSQKKGFFWYLVILLVAAGLVAVDIFFLRSYSFSVLILVMVAALFIYYRRPPQQIDYTVSPAHGLYVGEKLYKFGEFKSFGVISDAGESFIKLIPVKRFGLGLSVFFPLEMGEQVVDLFGAVLPMDQLKLEFIDTLIRKLRL